MAVIYTILQLSGTECCRKLSTDIINSASLCTSIRPAPHSGSATKRMVALPSLIHCAQDSRPAGASFISSGDLKGVQNSAERRLILHSACSLRSAASSFYTVTSVIKGCPMECPFPRNRVKIATNHYTKIHANFNKSKYLQ